MTLTQVVPDEPLICPVSPGAALSRLSEVIGALERHQASEQAAPLRPAREELMTALESGAQESINAALVAAQQKLIVCYESLSDADLCTAANFPPPGRVSHRERHLEVVDLSSVQMTFARFGKQIMASFAFRDAPGATAYWLREIRYIDDERTEWARLEDQIVQSTTPLFSRVRLPPGTRHFRIESRNPSGSVVTDEFTVEIPQP